MPVSLFNLNISGPPPGAATVGSELWIDLGSISTGLRIWFGSAQYTSPDKSVTFELRTNNTGQSAGTLAATTLLSSSAVSVRSGTVTNDMYRKGRLHIVSVYGTGTEHFWLRLKSKSGSAGGYLYSINYTTE